MNKINYQKELEHLIDKLPDHHRRLFLHSCCAPCSSYCAGRSKTYRLNPRIAHRGAKNFKQTIIEFDELKKRKQGDEKNPLIIV